MPMAAVWMGAGLAVALVDAAEAALEAELATLDRAPVAPVIRDDNSLESELALAPVAVASSELRDASLLDVLLSIDDDLDEESLAIEDSADDKDEEAALAADMLLLADESVLEVVLDISVVVVIDVWAWMELVEGTLVRELVERRGGGGGVPGPCRRRRR